MYVIKKDGTKEEFNVDKIIAAVNKSASRIMYRFTEKEISFICEYAKEKAKERSETASRSRRCTILWRVRLIR